MPEDIAGDRDYQHRGRVDVDLLRMQLPLKPYHFYICGPTPMMESLVLALEDWGVPDAHIHFEAFGPASIKRKHASTTAVAMSQSERMDARHRRDLRPIRQTVAVAATAGSLLEFAEANGITVNSGCRAGSCGSCQTTILNGEVAYRQPPDYDPEPGTCLLCVCEPKTSVTLEV